MELGVRELRDNLSKHLAEVKRGKTITVTEHGKVIARITPANRPTALERLIAEGRVRPAKQPKRPAPMPVKTENGAIVSDLVDDQRR